MCAYLLKYILTYLLTYSISFETNHIKYNIRYENDFKIRYNHILYYIQSITVFHIISNINYNVI